MTTTSSSIIKIILSVWSASNDSRKYGGRHEVSYHSRGNGCGCRVDSVHILTKDFVIFINEAMS